MPASSQATRAPRAKKECGGACSDASCTRSFFNKEDLSAHISKGNGWQSQQKFVCACGAEYSRKKGFREHSCALKPREAQSTRLDCGVCGATNLRSDNFATRHAGGKCQQRHRRPAQKPVEAKGNTGYPAPGPLAGNTGYPAPGPASLDRAGNGNIPTFPPVNSPAENTGFASPGSAGMGWMEDTGDVFTPASMFAGFAGNTGYPVPGPAGMGVVGNTGVSTTSGLTTIQGPFIPPAGQMGMGLGTSIPPMAGGYMPMSGVQSLAPVAPDAGEQGIEDPLFAEKVGAYFYRMHNDPNFDHNELPPSPWLLG